MGDLRLDLAFDGHRVRMVGTPERPEWVAKDVCRVLGIQGHRRAVAEIVPEEDKGVRIADTLGGPQEFLTVTEGGLYRLITRSRKQSARKFQAWLFGDVLPCIRKHGYYPAPPDRPALPETAIDVRDPRQLAAVVLQLTTFLAEKDQIVAALTPKAEGYDRLSLSVGDLSLLSAGRVLGRAPRLFLRQLQADGILFRSAGGTLEPVATVRAAGYMRTRLVTVGETDDGHEITKTQTRVTPTGMQWLAARYPATDRSGEIAERHVRPRASLPPVSH